jgi:hypothetical protein
LKTTLNHMRKQPLSVLLLFQVGVEKTEQ